MIKLAKKKTKETPKQKNKKKYSTYILVAAVVVAIIYLVVNYEKIFIQQSKVVATVNGEVITLKDLDLQYNSLPEQYKNSFNKQLILDQMVNTRILYQEALAQGIETSDEEVAEIIALVLKQAGVTREEFEAQLRKKGFSKGYLDNFYKEQLIISKLLNKTIFSEIKVSESEIENYYAQNDLLEQGISFEDAKPQIENLILTEQQTKSLDTYLAQLREKADIKISLEMEQELEGKTFKETKDDVCKEGDKPVIRLFSTTNCPKCMWVKGIFDSVAKEYLAEGKIEAYHWELDTGDNALTEKIEDGIPKAELVVFQKYNPESTVPTFIFGCKYVRIGIGYEDDINSEESEFRAIIEELTAS